MEGQVSPTTGDDPAGDDPPLHSATAASSSPRSAGHSHETYVIQIPKNQVYRVPPPENALIAERFRNGPETNNAKKPRFSRRLLISIIVLIVFIIIAITMLILYLILSPNGPMFSVLKVVVVLKNPNSSSNSKDKHPSYEISLVAKNPNTRTGFDYEASEDVTLLFGGKEIANGKFPAFHQEKDNSTKLKLVLSGSNNAGFPHETEKTTNKTKSKEPVSLALAMDVKMKMEFWFIKTWIMDSKTNCDFRVSTLRPESRVVSQKCRSQFKR
ncbi:hypothetical protein FNV43_RR19327 [Rhamnella rubrinervis]|uniref:Late embryogenesis abundant protein LEA-2 subgroup domain-containing protein n=1 Tax=Rhamnella rubrinervis TaxID=2594499 RepID=A0A8K0GWT8_9ROSA|nr:hypothetical protein FNV43_RR19327 [Rhamnella rubrinervis]